MWNVFDSSFVVVFLVYLGLRLTGLASNDGALLCSPSVCSPSAQASNRRIPQWIALTWLSIFWHAGRVYYFPGQSRALSHAAASLDFLYSLVFFAISNNVVVLSVFSHLWRDKAPYDSPRSLRAMIAEFLFFTAIACVCFSGLLFTLWTLGTPPQWRYGPLPEALCSLGQMDRHIDRVAHGSDLVREYISQFRTGRELSPRFWTHLDDHLCGAIEYLAADKWVPCHPVGYR
jgi:hypothetical protein